MVSCQKGPTRHAYAWQIGPFWQDTLDKSLMVRRIINKFLYLVMDYALLMSCFQNILYHFGMEEW